MTPLPVRLDGPGELDPELDQSGRREGARVVGASLADEPRAAAERGDPGRDVRRLAPGRSTIREVASAPGASGCSSRTITSSTRSPRQQIVIAYDPRMERRFSSRVAAGHEEDS